MKIFSFINAKKGSAISNALCLVWMSVYLNSRSNKIPRLSWGSTDTMELWAKFFRFFIFIELKNRSVIQNNLEYPKQRRFGHLHVCVFPIYIISVTKKYILMVLSSEALANINAFVGFQCTLFTVALCPSNDRSSSLLSRFQM